MSASFSKREAALPGARLSPRLSDPVGLQATGGQDWPDGSSLPPFKIGLNDFAYPVAGGFFGNIKGLPRLFVPILFEHRDMMYANSLELPLAL